MAEKIKHDKYQCPIENQGVVKMKREREKALVVQLKRESRESITKWATLASYSQSRLIVNVFVCCVRQSSRRQSAGGG